MLQWSGYHILTLFSLILDFFLGRFQLTFDSFKVLELLGEFAQKYSPMGACRLLRDGGGFEEIDALRRAAVVIEGALPLKVFLLSIFKFFKIKLWKI